MRRILLIVLAVTLAGGAAQAMPITDEPPDTKATPKDYREVLKMLRGIEESLEELGGKRAKASEGWDADCRGYSPEKTVRCAAVAFDTSAEQALSVWRCESGWGIESGRTGGHAHHGPFQYLYSTYDSQQESMPDIVTWYELSPAVHDVRSNILTAVAYASRHGWAGPWACA